MEGKGRVNRSLEPQDEQTAGPRIEAGQVNKVMNATAMRGQG